jgi:hypothetical protein
VVDGGDDGAPDVVAIVVRLLGEVNARGQDPPHAVAGA